MSSSKTKSPEVFDRYAANYAETLNRAIKASGESSEFFARLRVGLLRAHIAGRSVQRVLDYGCGVGAALPLLEEHFPGSEIVGFDPSLESVARASESIGRSGSKRVKAVSDLDHIPLPDASIDVVYSSGVIHHVEPTERPHWFRELRRVVRPSGLVVIFENNPFNPLTRRAMALCPFDEGAVMVSPGRLRRTFVDAGFTSGRPYFYFFFPRFLRVLRPVEPLLRSVPLGGQYYVSARPVTSSLAT